MRSNGVREGAHTHTGDRGRGKLRTVSVKPSCSGVFLAPRAPPHPHSPEGGGGGGWSEGTQPTSWDQDPPSKQPFPHPHPTRGLYNGSIRGQPAAFPQPTVFSAAGGWTAQGPPRSCGPRACLSISWDPGPLSPFPSSEHAILNPPKASPSFKPAILAPRSPFIYASGQVCPLSTFRRWPMSPTRHICQGQLSCVLCVLPTKLCVSILSFFAPTFPRVQIRIEWRRRRGSPVGFGPPFSLRTGPPIAAPVCARLPAPPSLDP